MTALADLLTDYLRGCVVLHFRNGRTIAIAVENVKMVLITVPAGKQTL
jgi:hypothetical protein